MPTAPAQYSSNTSTVSGVVNGVNKNFSIAPAQPAQASMLFESGLLITQPAEGTTLGNNATFVAAPPIPSVVTIEAWSPDPLEPAPLNLPVQFTTQNGSIQGALNGVNNVFTLKTPNLVTGLMLFWNGGALTLGRDYNWTCLQNSSAGPWVTMITTDGGNYPQAGDYLTAEAFLT
jgi:hypothetical protein